MRYKTLNKIALSQLSLLVVLLLSACEVKVEDADGIIKIKTTDENDPTWVDSEQLVCRDKNNSNSFTEIVISKLHITYALESNQKADMMPCYQEEGQVGGCLIPPYDDSKHRSVSITKFNLKNGEALKLFHTNIIEEEKSYGILLAEGSTSVKLIEDSSKRLILVRDGTTTSYSCDTEGKETRILGPTAEYFMCHSVDGKYFVSASVNTYLSQNDTNNITNVYVYNKETGDNYVPSDLVREVNPDSVSFSSSGFRLKASRSIDSNNEFYGTIEFNEMRLELSCSNGYYDDSYPPIYPETGTSGGSSAE